MIAVVKRYFEKQLFVVKIGILTGLMLIVFEIINLLVVYRYLKLDYYLSMVAIVFFLAGLHFNRKISNSTKKSVIHQLTTRELMIFQLIAAGKSNKEIADEQFVELSTVKTHINNIYAKLSIGNRKEARLLYQQMKSSGFLF
jgi:DNA-binding CsgD family transcriptional regulator